MDVSIASSIRIDSAQIPADLAQDIRSDLTIRHPDKERMVSEQVYGAEDLPDALTLWHEDDGEMILPRGYAHRLEARAHPHGIKINWQSEMTLLPHSDHLFRSWPSVDLRGYQIPLRDAMLDWAQGICRAPVGSGKTIAALEFARWAGQKTLIVVGKTALARQWASVAEERYGYSPGYIGEGEWREKDLTIAIWQSIWARRDSVPKGFWESFGCVIGDEIHHASASVLSDLLGRFSAFYRIGVSATPRWDPFLFPIIEAVIGPIIHEVTAEEVGDALIQPSVQIVKTGFEAHYVGTHFRGARRVSNNFGEIMGKLVTDAKRNDLIAGIAREDAQKGHHVLIVTRRVEQVKQLVARLEKTMRVGVTLHTLTGAQNGIDADRIRRAIGKSAQGTVLVSTVAEEALDIPRLDRVIMAFPLRRLPLVEQQIGRVMRPAPGKEDAVVYDIADEEVGVLFSQCRERRHFYARKRWTVKRAEEVAV